MALESEIDTAGLRYERMSARQQQAAQHYEHVQLQRFEVCANEWIQQNQIQRELERSEWQSSQRTYESAEQVAAEKKKKRWPKARCVTSKMLFMIG